MMKILKKLVQLCTCVLVCWPVVAAAGSVGTLHVLWVNLDVVDKNKDNVILNAIETGCPEMNDELIVYIKKRPPQLTNELAAKAFVNNDAAAINKLKRALVTFRDENLPGPKGDQIKGIDGIMVYRDKPQPVLMSLTTPRYRNKKIFSASLKKPFDADDFQEKFCSLLPDLTRKP